jgi:hypothetical protein
VRAADLAAAAGQQTRRVASGDDQLDQPLQKDDPEEEQRGWDAGAHRS